MTAAEYEEWVPEVSAVEGQEDEQKPVVIHWAREALEPQPPIEWLLERLCAAGSVGLVVGEGGTKKTWVMVDAAVCVALGKPWLNLATQPVTALIVDEESGERRLKRRLGAIMRAHDAGEETPVAFTSLEMFNFLHPTSVDRLDKALADTGARFVVIDALADVMVGGDENSVKDTQPVLLALRRLADKYEAAILLIHHTGKKGDYRGSSALKGAVDLLLKVTSEPKSSFVDFEVEKQRDAEPFKFSAEIEFELGKTTIKAGNGPATVPKRLAAGPRFALSYLAKHGPALLTEIKNKANTCSGEAARLGVYKLTADGYAERVDDGAAGTRARYGLTNEGRELAAVELVGSAD